MAGIVAVSTIAGTPGSAGDTTADVVLGQADFTHNSVDFLGLAGLSSPSAVATDAAGHLYVTDLMNNRVLGWADVTKLASGNPADIVIGQQDDSSNASGTTASSFSFICGIGGGIAADASGNLYVADACNNRVLEFDAPFSSGVTVGQQANLIFGQTSATNHACNASATGLCRPTSVATDAAGNLYVADTSNARVLAYFTPLSKTSTTGSGDTTADVVFGQSSFSGQSCNAGTAGGDVNGLGPDSLCSPLGVGVDSAGNLYVADTADSRVLEYNTPLSNPSSPNTTANVVFGQNGSFTTSSCNDGKAGGDVSGLGPDSLCSPIAVGFDPATADLYVADLLNNRVLEYNTPLKNPGSPNITANVVFGQGGSFTTATCSDGMGGNPGPNATGLCIPKGVALDQASNLYVADPVNNRVVQYVTPLANAGSPNTTANLALGQTDLTHNMLNFGGPAALSLPTDLTTDAAGHLYVIDAANNRVLGWNNSASLANGAAADIVIGQPDAFSYSCAATATQAGLCFSACIRVPPPFGSATTSGAVATDASNNLYVADTCNNRVLEFNAPFSSGMTAGQPANVVFGQANFTASVCASGGATPKPSASALCGPTGVAADAAGNVYIADTTNSRVLEYNTPLKNPGSPNTTANAVFGQNGSFSSFGCNSGTLPADHDGIGADSLCHPTVIAVDKTGNLYVADTDENRVLEYNTPLSTTGVSGSGDTIADVVFGQGGDFTGNGCGTDANSLCAPVALALDSGSNLYIADASNYRVVEFTDPLANPASPNTTADQVYGQGGSFVTRNCNDGVMGNPPPDADSLCGSEGVAGDTAGNVYIADTVNNRVLIYDLPPTGPASTPTPTPGPTATPTATATATPSPTPLPPGGTLSLSPKSINFGATGTGTTPKKSIVISNSGSGTLTVVLDLSNLVSPFVPASGTPTSFTLAHGRSKSIGIMFEPTVPGTPSASLEILTGDPHHPMTTVTVSGTAEPPVLKGPTSLNFGKVKVNTKKTLSFVIKDGGLGVLTGTFDTSALGSGFTMASSTAPFTLHSKKTLTVKVTFEPSAETPFSGTLTINSPNGGNLSIALSGTGT